MSKDGIENLYALSNGIQNIIKYQEIKKTELGKVFDIKLSNNNLNFIYSDFRNLLGYHILIYYNGTKEFCAKDRCVKEYNDYIPDKNFAAEILLLFKASVIECGMPYLIGDKVIRISFDEYYTNARSVFFYQNIFELDRLTRSEFSDMDFFLRFSMDVGEPGYYYLIFKSVESLDLAAKTGKVEEITNFVNSLCRCHDKLEIFENYKVVPFVSDKETLQNNGEVMGIMRNNPDFTTW